MKIKDRLFKWWGIWLDDDDQRNLSPGSWGQGLGHFHGWSARYRSDFAEMLGGWHLKSGWTSVVFCWFGVFVPKNLKVWCWLGRQRFAGTALGDPIEVGGMSLECNKMVWDCSECLIEVCEFCIHSKRQEHNQTHKILCQIPVVTWDYTKRPLVLAPDVPLSPITLFEIASLSLSHNVAWCSDACQGFHLQQTMRITKKTSQCKSNIFV